MYFDQISPALWDAFLGRLAELKSPTQVFKLDGMPSKQAFYRKLKEDPAFATQAEGLWRSKKTADIWEAILQSLGEHSLKDACAQHDVHPDTLRNKRKTDAAFDARVRQILEGPGRPWSADGTFEAKIAPRTWDAFIAHLERLGTPHPVTLLDGMPSRCAFDAKMRRDPVFAARAEAAWQRGFKSTNLRPSVWYTFLLKLEELGTPLLVCRLPGMPHYDTYRAKRQRDPFFAQRVDASWRRSGFAEDVWDRLLGHLAHMNIADACSQPGMPRKWNLQRRRQIDLAFNARVVAVIRDPANRHLHQPRYDDRDWDEFLGVAAQALSVKAACALPAMPSEATVERRARSDLFFRSALADIMRRQTKARIALRTVQKPRCKSKSGAKRKAAVPSFQATLSRDELYAAVAAAVPKSLPPITRDDIICDMMLAVLEGQIDVGQIKASAKDFIREHWRMFGTLRDKSLDANLFDDGAGTLGDRLAGHGADYW